MTYAEIVQLWDDYMTDHDCPSLEEFVACPICTRSQEAGIKLNENFRDIVEMLRRYHDRLQELVTVVISEIDFPRPQKLQEAMLKGLSLLEKK